MTASVLDRHFTDDDISNADKPVTEASVLPLQLLHRRAVLPR